MTGDDAVRFLEHEATYCRSRDHHEALCLLLPAILRVLGLQRMDGREADTFRRELRKLIKEK